MVSHFEIANEEYTAELKDERKWKHEEQHGVVKEGFKKWMNERNLQANLEEYENDVLNQRLSQFQLSIQKFSNFAL